MSVNAALISGRFRPKTPSPQPSPSKLALASLLLKVSAFAGECGESRLQARQGELAGSETE